MFKFFDSHTHLQSSVFDNDREIIANRILIDNIGVVNVGADKESSIKAVELAKKYPNNMRAAVGCHPHHIDEFSAQGGPASGWNYEFFKKLAQEPEVVAIGECGLDYCFRNEEIKTKNEVIKKQKDVFIEHIKLAKEVDKPIMVHCRDAFGDLIEILKTEINPPAGGLKPSIIHFFTGTLEDAKQLLEMGFYFTFNGLITFNRDFDEIIKYIPLNRILLETDAPYVAPLSHRKERNEPSYIVETAQKMAEIKGVSLEEIGKQTTENSGKCYNILKSL
ncbi:MAG: TatD family hydrolase [Patescibacteria group bacterium]|nr:TatD family hydrolase [Patescibacteria group bacterium]